MKRGGKDASKTGASFGKGGAEGQGGLRGNRAMGTNTPGGGAGYVVSHNRFLQLSNKIKFTSFFLSE